MRHLLLGFNHAAANRLTQLAGLYNLVWRWRTNWRKDRYRNRGRRRSSRNCRRSCNWRWRCQKGLNISFDNPSARPSAFDSGQIQAVLLGHTPGHRRSLDPTRELICFGCRNTFGRSLGGGFRGGSRFFGFCFCLGTSISYQSIQINLFVGFTNHGNGHTHGQHIPFTSEMFVHHPRES